MRHRKARRVIIQQSAQMPADGQISIGSNSHGQGLLFHRWATLETRWAWTLISVALIANAWNAVGRIAADLRRRFSMNAAETAGKMRIAKETALHRDVDDRTFGIDQQMVSVAQA